MNERIQELAEQADDYAYKEYAKKPSGHEREYFFRQKFAELIVRECAKVCDDIDSEYEGEDVLATWCAKAIKEHFGGE